MRKQLEKQKAACIRDGLPSAETRISRLDKTIELLCNHSDGLCEAMNVDFGHRSADQSRFSDISGPIDALKFAKKNVRSWMRTEKRSTQFPLGLFGARSAVHYQPKGVVGIISPWNFPVSLTIAPLAGVLAAWGIGTAPLRSYRQKAVGHTLDHTLYKDIAAQLPAMEADCRASLKSQGIADADIQTTTWVLLKSSGSDTTISLPLAAATELQTAFRGAHEARFGFAPTTAGGH